MVARYELKGAGPSWVNTHADASHNRLVAYVHASSMYSVVSNAKFNTAHGVRIMVIDPDPVGFDRISNNKALNLNRDLLFPVTTTRWSELFTDKSKVPVDRFMLDGVVINCGDELSILDAIDMWPHVKMHGKMVLIVPRRMYCLRPASDKSGVAYELRDELTTMAEDFYWKYDVVSYTLPELFYERNPSLPGEPEMWVFTKKESYAVYDESERAAQKGKTQGSFPGVAK